MASIHPLIFICFAACAGLLLSLWPRRSTPGATALIALSAAIWGGIWVQVLEGGTVVGAGLAHALFLLVPALLYMCVSDHLTAPDATNQTLRRTIMVGSVGFAALAATSPYHSLFLTLDEPLASLAVHYLPGSFLALGFAFVVAGLSIYSALVHAGRGASTALRSIVFIAFPLALIGLSLTGPMMGAEVHGLNPVVLGLALTLALGGVLLSLFESDKDDSVRNLLFARIPDPVVALDAQSRVLDCNDAFAELVDYPIEELQGSLLESVISAANLNALQAFDGHEFELRWEHAENVVEHYAVSAMPIEGKTDARLLHLTESDSHRHAQQALETADIRLEQANASLDRLTFNDELTGLANQRRFVDELEKEIARHQRSGLRFGVIAIEADDFNLLAEQHGTAFRDRSLALIARAIEVEVRDTDLCARLDGEEFAVLAVQMKVPGLVNLAERIRKRVMKVRPHAPGGERVRMSVSCGVGVFDPKQDDLRGLLSRTNRYLAQAQRSGRNQVVSDD